MEGEKKMILLTKQGEKMLYPYIELPDETIITHSEVKQDNCNRSSSNLP